MAVFMLGFDLSYISAESSFSHEERVLIIQQNYGPANTGNELTLEQLTRMVMETRMEEEKLQAIMDEILQRLEALQGTDYPVSTLVELFSIYQQSLWSLSSYSSFDAEDESSAIDESTESSEIQTVELQQQQQQPTRSKIENVDFAPSFQQRNLRQMTSPSEQIAPPTQKEVEEEEPSVASSVAFPRRKVKAITVDNMNEAGARFVPASSSSPSSPSSSARSSTSFSPSFSTMSNVPVLSSPIHSIPASSFSLGQNQSPQVGDGECRLIFSINAGRSGSGYLAEVLGLSPLINSGHERDPVMFGSELKMVKQMGLPATYQYRKMVKLPHIEMSMMNKAGKIYAESSHLFIKDFYDVVMDEFLLQRGCRVDVIVLRRYMLDTLASLARLEWQANMPNWYYTLRDTYIAKTRAPSPVDPDQLSSFSSTSLPELLEAQRQADMRLEHLMGVKKSDLEDILGYLIDLEQQTLDFKDRYPQANMIEVRLETLQTPEGVESLFQQLDLPLPADESIQAIAGVPVNQKGSQHPGLATEEEKELALREFVLNYRHRCAQEGISLPPLPSMKKLPE